MSLLLGCADARRIPLPDESVQAVITSPSYWRLRDYGVAGQIGLEASPGEYVAQLVAVFREVKRVLRPDGVVFLVIGDSYYSDPKKGGSGTPTGRNNRGENYARALQGSPATRYRLRSDLTPEQEAYVLSELANAASIAETTQERRE